MHSINNGDDIVQTTSITNTSIEYLLNAFSVVEGDFKTTLQNFIIKHINVLSEKAEGDTKKDLESIYIKHLVDKAIQYNDGCFDKKICKSAINTLLKAFEITGEKVIPQPLNGTAQFQAFAWLEMAKFSSRIDINDLLNIYPQPDQIKTLEPELRAKILDKKIDLLLKQRANISQSDPATVSGEVEVTKSEEEVQSAEIPQTLIDLTREYQEALENLVNEPNDESMNVIINLASIFMTDNPTLKQELIKNYKSLPKSEDNPLNQHGAMIYAKEWLALFDLSQKGLTELTLVKLEECQPTEEQINSLGDRLQQKIQDSLTQISLSGDLLTGAKKPPEHRSENFLAWVMQPWVMHTLFNWKDKKESHELLDQSIYSKNKTQGPNEVGQEQASRKECQSAIIR